MLINEFITESSGYIPQNGKEAHDPRYEMAITCDVKAGEDRKQAKKFGFTINDGKPPFLRSNGTIAESIFEYKLDNQKGIGFVDTVHSKIGSQGILIQMKPSTYLALVTHIVKHEPVERQSWMDNYVKSNQPIAAPTIRFTIPKQWQNGDYSIPAQVRGHEGRHRMKAILQTEGDVFVETILRLNYEGTTSFDIIPISKINPEWLRQINSQCIVQDDVFRGRNTITKGPFFKMSNKLI